MIIYSLTVYPDIADTFLQYVVHTVGIFHRKTHIMSEYSVSLNIIMGRYQLKLKNILSCIIPVLFSFHKDSFQTFGVIFLPHWKRNPHLFPVHFLLVWEACETSKRKTGLVEMCHVSTDSNLDLPYHRTKSGTNGCFTFILLLYAYCRNTSILALHGWYQCLLHKSSIMQSGKPFHVFRMEEKLKWLPKSLWSVPCSNMSCK